MNPWLGILLVLGVLSGLMALGKRFRSRTSPELSRKTVHVGMGCVCLLFPWIFQEQWPVVVLAFLAVLGLGAMRVVPIVREKLGGVLGGVERQSFGEIYFPLAVALVFLLAGPDKLLFIIPVLTLTMADSVGALVGIRYGFARYTTDEGLKSAEGSLAFFTAAFLSCHIPLLLFSETGRAESLLIGLTAGFVVMLLEAISWRGQDNLIIPIGMFFLLKFYLPMEASALLARFLVILTLVVLVLLCRSRTTLSDSAALAGALSGYAVWAFGGPYWLLPPLLLFVVYAWLPAFPSDARPSQNLHAVTRIMSGGFLWILLTHVIHRDFFLPYLLCMAAHTANIATARLRVVRSQIPVVQILMISWGLASFLFLLLAGVCAFLKLLTFMAIGLVPISTAISVALFATIWPLVHTEANRARIWISETAVAILASLLGLIFV